MQPKKYKSVTKLPELSIKKKEHILKVSRQFDQDFKVNEILENANKQRKIIINKSMKQLVQVKFTKDRLNLDTPGYIIEDQYPRKPKTPRNLQFENPKKDKQKISELVQAKLTHTKQIFYRTPSRINFEEKEQDNVRAVSTKRKKSAVQLKTQLKKPVIPYYSASSQKIIDAGFTTLHSDPQKQKIRIRVNNQVEKWVDRKMIFYRIGEQQQMLERRRQARQQQNFAKQVQQFSVNLDERFLNKIINRNKNRFKSEQQRKQMMRQLIQNYKMSILIFNKKFEEQTWKVTKVKSGQQLSVPKEVIYNLEDKLVCSEELGFLEMFGLSKKTYFHLLIDTIAILRKIEDFQHFQYVEEFTDPNDFVASLDQNKNKIELIIFQIEQHLTVIQETLYKDIQYVIKLNPRLVGVNYKEFVKRFIRKFQVYLGIAVRTTLTSNITNNIAILQKFIENIFNNQYRSYSIANHPDTDFYRQINKINKKYIGPYSHKEFQLTPAIIVLKVRLKKMKKKNYKNIYKFLLDSRKKIREYKFCRGKVDTKLKERFQVESVFVQIQSNLLKPIQNYIGKLSASENVNGCTNGVNISLHSENFFDDFRAKMKELSVQMEQSVVGKYQEYLGLWEIYFLEKPYLEQLLTLFKRINGIRFMQDQVNHLKADLRFIQGFPLVITDKLMKIDLTEPISNINTTINSNILKILKVSQDVLKKLLAIGQQETEKAKMLSNLQPFTTIGEYINFANTLSNRSIEEEIRKIARNSLIIRQNWKFLQNNNYNVKLKIMQLYLDSGTWVRILQKASLQNKQRLNIDYRIFFTGITNKKQLIYEKYNSMIKQLAEVIKVSQLVSWDKYSLLSQTIYKNLDQIHQIIKQIGVDENLLKLEYWDGEQGDDQKIYRQDFSFFLQERLYIEKFARFWDYVCKFKNYTSPLQQTPIIQLEGQKLLLLIRQGQQLLYQLKMSTINKRLLGLMGELHTEMQPYIKNMKIIKLATYGSQKSKLKILDILKQQICAYTEQRFQEIMERKKKQLEEKNIKEREKRDQEEQQGQHYQKQQGQHYEKQQGQLHEKQQGKPRENQQEQPHENEQGQPQDNQDRQIQDKLEGQHHENIKDDEKQQSNKKKEKIDDIEAMLSKEIYEENVELISLQKLTQIASQDITVSKLLKTPIPSLQLHQLYQVYIAQQYRTNILGDIKDINWWIKSVDIPIKKLQVFEEINEYQIVSIDDNFIDMIVKGRDNLVNYYENAEDNIGVSQLEPIIPQYKEAIKKLKIFIYSIQKIKKVEPLLEKLYPWMQCLLPALQPASNHYINLYKGKYENLMDEYCKLTDYIKRLSFHPMFEDKVKVNFDEQIRIFSQMFLQIKLDQSFGLPALNTLKLMNQERIFDVLTNLLKEGDIDLNTDKSPTKKLISETREQLESSHIINPVMKRIRYSIQLLNSRFYIYVKSIVTNYGETITFNKNSEELFKVEVHQIAKQSKEDDNKQGQKQLKQQSISLYTCEFGLFKLMDKINRNLSLILHRQTIQLISIAYECHYNIKLLFSIYLALEECLFQSLIIALYIVFFMDLSLVWENDYDITILKEKVMEGLASNFEAKEEENVQYVRSIQNSLQYFIGVIDVVIMRKNKEGGPGTPQSRQRRKYIMQFIPEILIDNFLNTKKQNRQWLLQLKKSKQDDFINETHCNPGLHYLFGRNITQYYQNSLDKIQFNQIEHKYPIKYDSLELLLLRRSQDGNMEKTLAKQLSTKKIVIKNHTNSFIDYNFSFVTPSTWYPDEIVDSLNSTFFILEAKRTNKLFVTDSHPNSIILGAQFLYFTLDYYSLDLNNRSMMTTLVKNKLKKVSTYQNCAIIVDQKKMLGYILEYLCLNSYIMDSTYFYIYSSCIDPLELSHYSFRELLLIYKKQVKFPRTIVNPTTKFPPKLFENSHFIKNNLLYPYEVSGYTSQMVTESQMRKPLLHKQKQLIQQAISEYYYRNNIDNFLALEYQSSMVNAMGYQAFMLMSDNQSNQRIIRQVMRAICEILEHKKENSRNLGQSSKSEKIGHIAVYKLTIYAMSIGEILGGYNYKQKPSKKNNQGHIIGYQSYDGLLYHVLAYISNKKPSRKQSEKLEKLAEAFLISDAHDQLPIGCWFILDLSIINQTTIYLYKWLRSGLSTTNFIFFNDTNIHYDFYSSHQTPNKIIVIANKTLIQSPSNSPLPLLNLTQIYNPILDFTIQIKYILSLLQTKSLKVPKHQQLTAKFAKVVQQLGVQLFDQPTMNRLFRMLRIMINQLRKYRLANGLYGEKQIPKEEKQHILVSSVDLREKQKVTHKLMTQLQEIEKSLDQRRKQIYRFYSSNSNDEPQKIDPVPLDQTKQKKISKNLDSMSFELSPKIRQTVLENILLQCIFSSLAYPFPTPNNKPNLDDLSSTLIKLFQYTKADYINQKKKEHQQHKSEEENKEKIVHQHHQILQFPDNLHLGNYGYDLASQGWVRWLEMRVPTEVQSCSSSEKVQMLHPAQILRLNSSAKLNNLRVFCSIVIKDYKKNKEIFNNHELYWSRYFILYGHPISIHFNTENTHYSWRIKEQLLNYQSKRQIIDHLFYQSEKTPLQTEKNSFISSNLISAIPEVNHNSSSKKKSHYLRQRISPLKVFFIQNPQDPLYNHLGLKLLAQDKIIKTRDKWRKTKQLSFVQFINQQNRDSSLGGVSIRVPYQRTPMQHYQFTQILSHAIHIIGMQLTELHSEINLKKILMFLFNYHDKESFKLLTSFYEKSGSKVDSEMISLLYGYQAAVRSFEDAEEIFGFVVPQILKKLKEKEDEKQGKNKKTKKSKALLQEQQRILDDQSQLDSNEIWKETMEIVKYVGNYRYQFNPSAIQKTVPRYLLKKPKKYKNPNDKVKPTSNELVNIQSLLSTENSIEVVNVGETIQGSMMKQEKQDTKDHKDTKGLKNSKDNKKKKNTSSQISEIIDINHKYVSLYEIKQSIILVSVSKLILPNFDSVHKQTQNYQSYVMGYILYTQSQLYNQYLQSNREASKIFSIRDPKVNKIIKQLYKNLDEPIIVIQIISYFIGSQSQLTQYQCGIDGKVVPRQSDKPVLGILRFIYVMNNKIQISRDILLKETQPNPDNTQKCASKSLVFICNNDELSVHNPQIFKSGSYIYIQDNRFSIEQTNETQFPLLSEIASNKYNIVFSKLTELLHKVQDDYISNYFVGKIYKKSLQQKFKQIEEATASKVDEQLIKKDVLDGCLIEIDTISNQIDSNRALVSSKQEQKIENEDKLLQINNKETYYIGEAEYLDKKQKLLAKCSLKQLEKQLLNSSYIEHNSFNLSFIYRFNVLADPAYFPDKITEMLEGPNYQLTGKYQIMEEQRKNFIKLVNYGRTAVMLQNQQYAPNWDQLHGYSLLMSRFGYFGEGISSLLCKQHKYSSDAPLNLKQLLKKQEQLIDGYSANQVQKLFHIYISYLSAHFYTKTYLTNTKASLQKAIKVLGEQIKVLKNKISIDKSALTKLQESQVHHQKKYEKACAEVRESQNNQQLFTEISQENVLIISQIYLESVFKTQEIRKKSIHEITLYITEDLCNPNIQNRRVLSLDARRCLIFMIGLQSIAHQIVQKLRVGDVETLVDECLLYLVAQLIQLQPLQVYRDPKPIITTQTILEENTYNIVIPNRNTKTQYFLNQVFQEYENQMSTMLSKLQRQITYLEASCLKFNEKIDLVQSRNTESIKKLRITEEVNENIVAGYQMLIQNIGVIPLRTLWVEKNQELYQKAVAVLELYRQTIDNKFEGEFPRQSSDQYFLYYLGQILKRNNLLVSVDQIQQLRSLAQIIIVRMLYEHSSTQFLINPQLNFQTINEIPLNKLSLQNLKKRQDFNCLLQTPLSINVPVIMVRGNAYIQRILQKMSQKYFAAIIDRRHEGLEHFFIDFEETTKFRWIVTKVNYISHPNYHMQLKQKIHKLQQQLIQTKQSNTIYLFIVNQPTLCKYISKNIQPIYQFYYQSNILSKLYHQTSQQTSPLQLLGKIHSFYVNRCFKSINNKIGDNFLELSFNYVYLFMLTANKIDDDLYQKNQAFAILDKMVTSGWLYTFSVEYRILMELVDDEIVREVVQCYEGLKQDYAGGGGESQREKYRRDLIKLLTAINKKYYIQPSKYEKRRQISWPQSILISPQILSKMLAIHPSQQSKTNQKNNKIVARLIKMSQSPNKKLKVSRNEIDILSRITLDPKLYLLLSKVFNKIMMRIDSVNQSNSQPKIHQNPFGLRRNLNNSELKQILGAIQSDRTLDNYEKLMIMGWGEVLIRGIKFTQIQFKIKLKEDLSISLPSREKTKLHLEGKSLYCNIQLQTNEEDTVFCSSKISEQSNHFFIITPILRYPETDQKNNDAINNIQGVYLEMGRPNQEEQQSDEDNDQKLQMSKIMKDNKTTKNLVKTPQILVPVYHQMEVIGVMGIRNQNQVSFDCIKSHLQI